MDLLKTIELDFYNPRYISINAKQYDKTGRAVKIVCTNEKKQILIDRNTVYAYVKYRRADGVGVFSPCKVEKDGTITMVLREEMLEVSGKCYADIVLIECDTARSPLTENGFFVVSHAYDEDLQKLSVEFSPNVVTEYEDGVVKMKYIEADGKQIKICDNPAPFAAINEDEKLVLATIDETGKITMENPRILSTMPFCVNVIESSFWGKCNGMMR